MSAPLYEATARSQQWAPDELSEPFNLDEAIRASYFLAELQTTVRRHHELQRVADVLDQAARPRDARGRFMKQQS